MSILKIACMDETAATIHQLWFGPDFADSIAPTPHTMALNSVVGMASIRLRV